MRGDRRSFLFLFRLLLRLFHTAWSCDLSLLAILAVFFRLRCVAVDQLSVSVQLRVLLEKQERLVDVERWTFYTVVQMADDERAIAVEKGSASI